MLPSKNGDRLTDRQDRLVVAKPGGGGVGQRGFDWMASAGRCKLLHFEWIDNTALLCSKGNYIRYSVINYNGNEYKNNVYVCIMESLCYAAEIGTIL